MRATASLLFVAALIVLVPIGVLALRTIPAQHVPWAPLSLEDPIGLATSAKVSTLRNDSGRCGAVLETAQLLELRVAESDAGTKACPLRGSFVIERSSVVYGQEMAAFCALAAAIYVWEREILQPTAQKHLGAPVVRIDTYGTFACRNVYNQQNGRRSEHANANALDVSGFRLADGRRITLVKDWHSGGASAAFLRAVRDKSCTLFNGVLSPDYNEAHADHFHLDMGPYQICK